ANVLVTHHPAFLAAPDNFAPEASVALSSGAGVWAAIRHQVALMDFHTALDVSPQAARVLPGMLGLRFTGRFAEPLAGSRRKGYGQISEVPANDDAPRPWRAWQPVAPPCSGAPRACGATLTSR
ncbi:MAG: Nif3-like dinuclear metal center hexameric protein, partial [Adlercreutzia sp.]|nr:Nif3-like dinuclear metal center hexameric protein [Adlercreutzia sp.]